MLLWVFEKLFQIDMSGGIILEETYQKWIQYKDDCIKMIKTEPLPLGISFHLMFKGAAKFGRAYLLPDFLVSSLISDHRRTLLQQDIWQIRLLARCPCWFSG